MIHGRGTVQAILAVLISFCVYSDDMVKIKNVADAMVASIVYLRGQNLPNSPGTEIQWQGKTIFSGGPQDLVTTSKQFTAGSWVIDICQNLAPLRNTVYQVAVFDSKEGWYWKGSIKADGSVSEETPLKQLSLEDRQKMTEELLRESRNPAPVGGYGH